MVGQPLPVRAPGVMPARRDAGPGLRLRIWNFLLFELAWFAAVVGAAHHQPAWGSVVVLAVMAWHLCMAVRPRREAWLLLAVLLLGAALETIQVRLGFVRYADAGSSWPPPWLVLLWPLLAITLNVSLRWLRGRPWLAVVLGGIGGPLAFAGGVRLGAAQWVDETAALVSLAVLWAAVMPMLLVLARRLDGMTKTAPPARGAALA